MTDFYIYIIENIKNNKMYVGKTSNPNRRWKTHCRNAHTCKTKLYNAMRKYGVENFEMILVERKLRKFCESIGGHVNILTKYINTDKSPTRGALKGWKFKELPKENLWQQ